MARELDFKTTQEINVNKNLIDQVIGQDDAVKVIKKAALQRRHVLLLGEPGTGKSLLGMSLAELLPKEKLVDMVAFPNPNDEQKPLIRTLPTGTGREFVMKAKMDFGGVKSQTMFILFLILAFVLSAVPFWLYRSSIEPFSQNDLLLAAGMLTSMVGIIGLMFMIVMMKRIDTGKHKAPKLIVDTYDQKHAPFMDATGAHSGALLGDVLHDPFQTGGLGVPPHERVVAGMIHKAHMGVLFIDEISVLKPQTQQELLTALQERKYPITGQGERSVGAMVRTEAVPCNFVMVAAGNEETLRELHPALRSRIKGYGYEVYMKSTMKDTVSNREKMAAFIAQEVKKEANIPHFSRDAVLAIIEEARRMANRKDHLTLHLRELGGLVRAAGDLANERKAKLVEPLHVEEAKTIARSLEKQMADQYIERRKDYQIIVTTGKKVGRVNGLAVIGGQSSNSGIILPIESEVTPTGKKFEIIATGKLGEIAKEAVTNVSAIIKKYFGDDIRNYDLHVQFLQTYEGVEGDSASIAVASAIISSLKEIPIRQYCAMTGSLSVRGEVLPVGGITSKVEAAINAGMKKVIIPKTSLGDLILKKEKLAKIKIVPVQHIKEVLQEAFDWNGNQKILKQILKK